MWNHTDEYTTRPGTYALRVWTDPLRSPWRFKKKNKHFFEQKGKGEVDQSNQMVEVISLG